MIEFKYILLLGFVKASIATPLQNESSVGASCTITSFSQVSDVVKSCTNIIVQNLAVPAGKTLELDLKSGSTLSFRGTTTFGYGTAWDGYLVLVKGDKLTVTGESGSKLDGQGAHYWDGQGDKGPKKPRFFRIQATSSTFSNINILNCPHQCVSISKSKQVTLLGWNVDVSAGDRNNLGHNTDGFGLGESDTVTIKNAVVMNQDDCLVVNSGKNYHFENLQCSGGHGLSFSVGQSTTESHNQASNITFIHCVVKNSRNGIHVKTHSDGGKGLIRDVTYSDIELSGITRFGVNVQQDYSNGGSSGHANNNVPIQNLDLNKVTGTMKGSDTIPVYILCGSGSCSNFKWSGVSITGAHKKSSCNYHPTGFNC